MTSVRIVVPARNEQARLGAMLGSVRHALRTAEELGARWQTELVVVLDRCHDQTERIARDAGASVIVCPPPFGKVEALRAGLRRDGALHVCADADVLIGPRTLFDLIETLLLAPNVLAASPPLAPLPLVLPATPLAWALQRYNAARGISSERMWLSGRCYALRFVDFPEPVELARRAEASGATRFHGQSAPLLADDIWLSRALLARASQAIRHVDTDPVRYRAPSSWRGMSRTYRRLQRELTRVDLLFPELPRPARDRRVDSLHGLRDRLAFSIFQLALAGCHVHAQLELAAEAWLSSAPDPWPVVKESKR